MTAAKLKTPKRRLRAGEEPGVGAHRYRLMREAATRINASMSAGYCLEAVTLIESVLSERLEKRAQYLHDHAEGEPSGSLVPLKDGFKNLGPLLIALKQCEPDPTLRSLLATIDAWRDDRNGAIHEMAKYGLNAKATWDERLDRAREIAQQGIQVLLAYDEAERRVSHAARKKPHSSATCPDALGPIGQPRCTYCEPPNARARR